MTDDPKRPALPILIERHVSAEGEILDAPDEKALGAIRLHFFADDRLRDAIANDATGATRKLYARAAVKAATAAMSELARSRPEDTPATVSKEGDEDEDDDEDLELGEVEVEVNDKSSMDGFDEGDVFVFGDSRYDTSWKYGVYCGTDDFHIKYQGMHRELGKPYYGVIPMNSYILEKVPLPCNGIDGLIYALTVFQAHDETFYREAFAQVTNQDILRDIALDKKRVPELKAALAAVRYMENPETIKMVKAKIGRDRGNDFIAACDKRLRDLRGGIGLVMKPDNEGPANDS